MVATLPFSDGQPQLLDALVRRSILRHRNGISYMTARSWRSDQRSDDIRLFKAEKRAKSGEVIAAAASELADEAKQLLGGVATWCVTCVACGHSRDPECWGKLLAREVAQRLGVPFVQAFGDRFVSGVSHPKENRKLPPLEWSERPTAPVLLIDDVATSGWHLEEALGMLRGDGESALALAWIGGAVTPMGERPMPGAIMRNPFHGA